MTDRRQESYAVRVEAAELARSREHPDHKANGDEQRYEGYMSFTKGLPHNPDTGLLHDPQDFVEFRRAIDDGFIDPFSDRVKHGARFEVEHKGGVYETKDLYGVAACTTDETKAVGKDSGANQSCLADNFRQWEAPTTGVVFELEGPDAQAVTMPPAPPLMVGNQPNPEMVLEMAEVYELAILRDQPFCDFEEGKTNSCIQESISRLNQLPYIQNQTGRPRKVNGCGQLDDQTIFRGSSPGVEVWPYLSQFLLIGTTDRNGKGTVADGKISYGVLHIDQKLPVVVKGKDFMLTMPEYVAVQRGLKQKQESYESEGDCRPNRRFITTPRDLATYVHYDALYEAYLNACMILLEMKTPLDPAFNHLSGVGAGSGNGQTRRNAGGFALYGGPHILTLVTEVATRALKAVRFQKFNNHIRLRPEALAARIHLVKKLQANDPEITRAMGTIPKNLSRDLDAFAGAINAETLNKINTLVKRDGRPEGYFLPMAFPEGSPMHPAYGAGHATVAGACVTILKAFFDTNTVLAKAKKDGKIAFQTRTEGDKSVIYRPPAEHGDELCESISSEQDFLTLEGELNKLAANISIGRDMAGVHYFSDYYDSLRMGEKVALGILEEQALTYSTDPFVLSIPTFDGDVVRIGHR